MLGLDDFGSFFWIRVRNMMFVSNIVMENFIFFFDLFGSRKMNDCKIVINVIGINRLVM